MPLLGVWSGEGGGVQGVEAWRVACHEGGGEGRGMPPDTGNSTRLLLCPGPPAQGGACAGLQGPAAPGAPPRGLGGAAWSLRHACVHPMCGCMPGDLFRSNRGTETLAHSMPARSPIPVRSASCTGWEMVCGMVICRSVG